MPSEEYAKEHFGIKFLQQPKTKFKDNLNSVKVVLLDYPDAERLKKVFVNFSEGSWFENFYEQSTEEEKESAIHDLLSGNILGQGLEAAQFTFLVSGVDLNSSHAIVRTRIGICYLQQSGAIRDMRHDDILVPRAFTKYPKLLERYKQWCLEGKHIYSDLLETNNISITDARVALPRTIPVWINISCNLATLLQLYSKRSDTQEEYPNLNIMVEKMKELVLEKFPYMKDYFVSSCDKKTCLHTKSGYKCNCVFKRDYKHKTLVDNWTLHNKTKKELMLDAEEYQEEHYIGYDKVKSK